MSYSTPDPGRPPYTVAHATVVVIDGLSGLPAGSPGASPQSVTVVGSAMRASVAATIAADASVSNALDLTSTALLGFIAPVAWTAAALNIEVSPDNVTWAPAVLSADNTAVGSWPAVVAGNAYAVDPVAMLPFRYVRFRSGTFDAPTSQGAQRTFAVLTRPLA